MKREDVLKLFPGRLRDILGRANLDFDRLQEIRLRVNKPDPALRRAGGIS